VPQKDYEYIVLLYESVSVGLGVVIHACNPSNCGDGDGRIIGQPGQKALPKKKLKKRRTGT
jgi:hypothetical protein